MIRRVVRRDAKLKYAVKSSSDRQDPEDERMVPDRRTAELEWKVGKP